MTWRYFVDFLEMGGYALYVWGAYATLLAGILIELLLLHLRTLSIVGHLGWNRDHAEPADEAR